MNVRYSNLLLFGVLSLRFRCPQQCDPKKGGYWSQITFNDGAMIGVRGLAALNRDFIVKDESGAVSLMQCCNVAGLGPDRPGTYDYYLSEPIRDNDAKGVGPYLMALVEISHLKP